MNGVKKAGLVRKIFMLLSGREQKFSLILLCLMIIQAGAELVGIASIAPFMGVVADEGLIHKNMILASLYELGGFTTNTRFLTALGVAVIIVLALTNIISAITTWAMNRFIWGTHHRLSIRLLCSYISQPYIFFINNNASALNKNILSEVQTAVERVLLPTFIMISRSLIVIAIVGLLVFMDPILSLAVVVVLGGAYGTFYMGVRRKQAHYGRVRTDSNEERYKLTSEAFGGIKDVKVLQREADFIARFAQPSRRFSQTMASNRTIAVLPRYFLETVAFGSILLIVIYYLQAGQGVEQILPVLGLYAFAGLRLMPALQQMFSAATEIRFNYAVLDDLVADLQLLYEAAPRQSTNKIENIKPFQHQINIDDLYFGYAADDRKVLSGVSLTICRNQTIGLVGASGAGKTTLVDILLGLLEPVSGQVLIDGVALGRDNLAGWHKQVGYVPQHIFITDDSILHNIAFGVPPSEVCYERAVQAAHIARLHDFIQALPEGYQTVVGERGVRLSGGQRQRIGIARALYHDPEVLIMDEATSALDGETEDALMEAIRQLAGHKTIILIAHRLSTIRECDCIYLLGNGVVLAKGTYAQLAEISREFRVMAKIEP